jgi:hypothetical protein
VAARLNLRQVEPLACAHKLIGAEGTEEGGRITVAGYALASSTIVETVIC